MKSLNSFFIFRSSRPNLQSSYISLDRWLTVGSPSGLDAKWKQNPFMRFAVVLTLIFTLGVGNLWADYASNFTDKSLSVGSGELTWSASPAFSSYESTGSARGAQSAKATTAITITSTNITGTITGIEVVGSMNGAGSMSVTVGGSDFGNSASITKGDSKKTYSFTGNATITDKAVVITVTRSTRATFWIKSVTIQVGTTKTYHEWDGSEYQTSKENGTTISKAPTALCSVGSPASCGWVTEEYAGKSAPSCHSIGNKWPDGETDLYAVYYYDAGDGNAYYSTHPTIYYVTYSTTHATLDEDYSHTCTTDILDLASQDYGSYVYAYYTPESGYSLDETCFTFTYTSGGGTFTPSDMSYNSETGELWIDGVDEDITITAVAKTCTKLANATDLSVNTNYQSNGNTYVRFSWTPGTGTTTNATNQEICFGLVGDAGKCESSLPKKATYTGDLKSKLEDGEYWWSIKALGDGTTYCDGDAVDGAHFTICNTDITSSTPDIVPGTPDKTSCEVLFDLTGANSYSVTLKNNSTNAVVGSYNNVSNTTGDITFTGLTPSTTYRVEITGHNACGDISLTGSETFTTDAATLYTVTFHNAAGDAPGAVTQTTEGGTVSIPSVTACDGWEFAGWKIGSAQSSVASDPTGSGYIKNATYPFNYTPTGNITVYSVFKKTEGGGGDTEVLAKSIGFESSEGFTASTTYNNESTPNTQGPTGEKWNFIMGTPSSNDALKNSQSAQMRSYSGNYTAGYVMMTYNISRVTKVKFLAKNNGTGALHCYYSTNSGSTWVGDQNMNINNTATYYTYTVSATGAYANVRIKFQNETTNSAGRVYIDSVYIYHMEAGGGTTTWRSDVSCTCPNYSFHSKNSSSVWEDPICFAQVGSSTLYRTEEIALPTDGVSFKVGWHDADDAVNAKTSEKDWAYMVAGPTTTRLGGGYWAVGGHLTSGNTGGAKGYFYVYSDSKEDNKYVGFTPSGYVLRWGKGESWTSKAFTAATASIDETEWNTEAVTLSSSNASDHIYVGLKTESGYVWCNNSEEQRVIFLSPGVWDSQGCKFALWDKTHLAWRGFMQDSDGDGIYEGTVPSDCKEVTFARFDGAKTDPVWDEQYNKSADQTISSLSDKNMFSVTGWGGTYCEGNWNTVYAKPGVFRINAGSNLKNWSCKFVPHYVLTYDKNDVGASGSMDPATVASDALSKNVSVAACGFTAPTGYHFDHWNTAFDGSGTDYNPNDTYNLTADATLYAIWAPNNHTLTWEYDGGTPSGSYTPAGTVAFGTALTAPTVTKTGYQFNSWSPAVDATMPDKDVTYTATWTANTYTVQFNANGGDGSMSPQKFTYGVAQNLTSNSFTHATKSFGGWATSEENANANPAVVAYTNGQEVNNLSSTNGAIIDLYAVWVDCDLYTVTLNVNGDTWKTVTQGSCDAAIDLSSYQDVPSCGGGYTFVGWSETNPGTTTSPTITTSYTPESNTTLYAVYSKSDYIDWRRIESTGDLEAYETYIITSYDYNRAMSATQGTNNRDHTEITKSADKKTIASVPNTVGQFSIIQDGSNWNIYDLNAAGEGETEVYLIASGGDSKNKLTLTDDDTNGNAEWSISITEGAATVKAQGDATRNWMLDNGGTFTCYGSKSSSYKLLSFYKYVHEPATSYTTQPDMTVYTITKGAEDAAVGTYTVTPGLVCSGSSVSLSATPTGSNTFIGWESDKGGTFANASSATTTFTPSAATTTITANFGLAIVLDKNNVDGGSADGSAYVRANATSLSGVSAPTRTGYTVEGYYAEAGCTQKVADKEGVLQANVSGYTDADGAWTKGTGATLYAKWTANPHTLTWNFDGGESSLTAGVGYTAGGTVNYGTAITYPTNVSMTKTGYTFTGWSSSPATMPDADLTITALWTQNNYTLTMAANPADKGANITSPRTGAGTVDNKHYGDAITVTVTEPEHYTFTGWTSSNGGTFTNASDLSTTFTMPDNATTVTANFTEDAQFTVTWSDNGDASNTTQVYSGETTTFPALEGCDMYVAAGWVLDDGTFTSETMTKPGTIYAAGATTPVVSGNVTYKAVYRHKYYTTDEFVLNTTTAGGYYLSVNPGTVRYSGAKSGSKLGTVTNKANAVPVYVEKEAEGQYSFKLVGITDEQYIVGNNGADFGWRATKTDDYKWNVAAGTQGKGDYHILNAGTNSTRGFIYNNGSGNYIGNYDGSNVTSGGSTYYDMNFVPGYYYKYSPTKACYVITITSNNWIAGEFETIDPSTKVLDGTMLTVKVACGKTISSWSFTSGTATLASGENPEYIGMEGDKEVYRFTIIPTSDVTLKVNFGNGAQRTISFLDGSTVLGQTKTAAITDKRDCDSYTLPAGYNTASGDGGACTDWTFDGWTATNYTYGQMGAPEGIVAAGTSEDIHGDATWYAVYHKTFAAGAYFKLKYGDKYISDYSSNKFTTSETEADGLMFGLENDYLYYIDKTTRGKVWVYYVNSTNQNVTIDTNKPTSNTYKTTFTENSGTYEIKCNGRWLELKGNSEVVFYATTEASRRPTRPDAAGFTAYYPKTDCAIEYVTVTYDAGAGNSCSPASVTVESGSTFTLPVEADITYDNSDWTFVGWSAETVQGVVPGAPGDLIAGGGSYSTFVNVTLHAVYSQTPPDPTFNNSEGGRYIIWGEDGDISYYAKSNGQTQGKLSNTLACSEAAIFEFVETENAGEYKIHIVGEDKYFAGEGCGNSDTDFKFVAAGSAPVWTVAAATGGVWSITSTCGDRSFIFQTDGSKQFGHYASSNIVSNPGSYKNVHIGQCDDYYTTNPNKTLSVTGDVLVTSTNGRMVMAKDQLTINASNIGSNAPVTITSNSSDVYFSTTRAVNISKATKPTTSVSINANAYGVVDNQPIYVHYMPSVATDGIEEVLVTVTSPEKTVEHTIKVRHLPATFAIAAKVGKNWYALTGNMNGAKTPAAIQIEVDESSWTAYAPDTCAYQLWPVKTTDANGDRYQAQGEKVRFSAVNNKTAANAGLWANNSVSQNTINNDAAITAITSDPATQYEWKIAATEVGSTWKYTLQMEAGTNNNKLNIHRDAKLVWGTYTDGQAVTSDIYLLPISEITPFEFQVVEWYPTKVLIQTEAALASPSVKIAGEAVASPVLTNKGGKLWEISGLTTLAANPTEMLKINYTKDAVTYSGIKSIPVIISRSTQNVTAEPFTTLTKEVYNYADLVVRDGAVLTMNGTEAENKFYDVTIYPTSKISVPEGKKLGVHSLTFFGGIDEIYNGSTYTVNKYGVPELSLKGQFGTKTVGTIDYVMRVDDSQMYSLTVPYDVNLADITYWDGTSMGNLGDKLWVSAYDGDARAKKDMSHTWIWEANFASKGLEEKLKAGVGYTISADLQPGVGSTSSIIRMPMASNVAVDATELAKTVAVTAHGIDSDVSDNHKGWNLVGNPYMVSISGGDADSKLVVGYLKETGTGPWELVSDTYRYVTIPADNGQDYRQEKFSSATLKPFKNFFLQIATSGDLSFALASRQNSPARYLEAQKREVEFEINLTNGSHEDHTGLLIAEEYSPAYEINADLEKMENAMAVYTLTGGYKLAYNALSPDDASQPVPVGYVANVAGTYTFDLDETSDVSEVEHIWLTDYELSRVVDLIDDVYEFTTSNGRNESRFALSVELKDEQQTPTGILDAEANDGRALKFIWQDKMYILRNGVIYDATGKQVGETNK